MFVELVQNIVLIKFRLVQGVLLFIKVPVEVEMLAKLDRLGLPFSGGGEFAGEEIFNHKGVYDVVHGVLLFIAELLHIFLTFHHVIFIEFLLLFFAAAAVINFIQLFLLAPAGALDVEALPLGDDLFFEGIQSDWVQVPRPELTRYLHGICIGREILFRVEVK